MALAVGSPELALLTVEEVARILRISRAKAYSLAAAGTAFPVVRLGRSVRVRRDRLEEWLDDQSSR
jgi:excisionase family DNA binding protein